VEAGKSGRGYKRTCFCVACGEGRELGEMMQLDCKSAANLTLEKVQGSYKLIFYLRKPYLCAANFHFCLF
jgi:hypothetical protein